MESNTVGNYYRRFQSDQILHTFGILHFLGFSAWNTWRQADGFLCRNHNDCNWLDSTSYCHPRRFGWTINPNWFNGDGVPIGSCECENWFITSWDDYYMQCKYKTGLITLFVIIGLILLAVLGCLFYGLIKCIYNIMN